MKKQKDNRQGYGKLLDAWIPPKEAGEAIGCVATSFTFSPTFFEEECLGRFLQLNSDALEDGPVYLIEREEKLSSVMCATVIVDQHHCRGSRSLRWDLLGARLSQGGVLHAKISLLRWRNVVRVIVASANLTDSGYRLNREIFAVLDYFNGSEAPLKSFQDIIAFLDEIVSNTNSDNQVPSPAMMRVQNFLKSTLSVAGGWGSSDESANRKTITVKPVLISKQRPSGFEQLKAIWPANGPPTVAVVTSPFYNLPEVSNKPVEALWSLLRQRGSAWVSFNVTVDEIPGEQSLFINAPESILASTPAGRKGVGVSLHRIKNDTDKNGKESGVRPLHMKSIRLENDNWAVYMVGSSNFTSAGMGLSEVSNIEANLVYQVCSAANLANYQLLKKCFPTTDLIDSDQDLCWQSPQDDDELLANHQVVLPFGFQDAEYGQDNGQPYIKLSFGKNLPTYWRVLLAGCQSVLYSQADWEKADKPQEVTLIWNDSAPPSGFDVYWDESDGAAWWPVNIVSSNALPPPEELMNLPLDILISILTSARPLHEVLRRYLKNLHFKENSKEALLTNPHDRVDTSSFLLQRTRRLSFALSALRQRLELPVATEEILHWRLYGPVGVNALKKAILKEAHSNHERQFLIAELALELSRVKLKPEAGCLSVDSVKQALNELIVEMKDEIDLSTSLESSTFMQYINSAFTRAIS